LIDKTSGAHCHRVKVKSRDLSSQDLAPIDKTVQQLQLAQSGCVRADFPICPAVPLGKSHEIDITAGQVRALYYQRSKMIPPTEIAPYQQ